MIRKILAFVLFLSLLRSISVFAQDDDLRATVDYKVHKMRKVLNLTESQAEAIAPIIKDYMTKRLAVLDQAAGQGIIDHIAVKSTLKELKESEYHKLSKILNEDQMKKWIEKENLMATLNPDSAESRTEDGTTLGMDGANFRF